MKCMHCNADIDNDMQFCPLCGKALGDDNTVYLDDTGPVALDMGDYGANSTAGMPLVDPTMAAFNQPAQTYQPPVQQMYQAQVQPTGSQPIYVQTVNGGVAPVVQPVVQPVIQPVAVTTPEQPQPKKSKAPVIAGIAAALAGLAVAALIVFVAKPFDAPDNTNTASSVASSASSSASDAPTSTPAGDTQKDGASNNTGTTTAVTPAPEPVEYNYKVVQGKFTWSEAKAYCEKAGVSLACAHDADDWDKIVAAAADSGLRVLWTGGYKGTDGEWHWIDDGSAMSFTSWASGEPNNEYGVENRVALLWARNAWSMFDTPDDMGSTYQANRMGLIMQVPW